VKAAVDRDFGGGQFLLTGSLPDAGTHSGAGRITSMRMRPLSFAERGLAGPTVRFAELLAGTATLDGYIERIIDSDVKEMGLSVRRPATLRAWLASYAAATATTAKWETIRDAANPGSGEPPTRVTVVPYRDALTRLRILDELPAWLPTNNEFTRVASGSKHFLADPALALRLLELNQNQLFGEAGFMATAHAKPLFGRMFEALVALTVRTAAEAQSAKVMHFRDARGFREIDLIVQRTDGKILAIETKLSETVTKADFKHLNWLEAQLGAELIGKVVIYSGKYAYQDQGVAVVPLALLGD